MVGKPDRQLPLVLRGVFFRDSQYAVPGIHPVRNRVPYLNRPEAGIKAHPHERSDLPAIHHLPVLGRHLIVVLAKCISNVELPAVPLVGREGIIGRDVALVGRGLPDGSIVLSGQEVQGLVIAAGTVEGILKLPLVVAALVVESLGKPPKAFLCLSLHCLALVRDGGIVHIGRRVLVVWWLFVLIFCSQSHRSNFAVRSAVR